jgi:cobalt-zinc-cadmium efflux system protein
MILIMTARRKGSATGRENAVMGTHSDHRGHDHPGDEHAARGAGGHDHGDVLRRTAARNVGRLWVALAITISFVVVEAVTAFVAGSLALLSDAAHMLTDGVAIALALGAIVVANRASTEGSRTYGLFRLEILASLVNAVLTFGVAGYVLVEAAIRLSEGDSHVEAGPMLVVAVAGLAINLVVFFMLRAGAQDSLAVRGAYVDAMADAAGSVGVIAAAIVIETTGWTAVDPIVAAIIGIWIMPRAWRLAASALRVLLQVAPARVDLEAIRRDLLGVPGVVDVHDLHVWTLTSEMDVASAHVMIGQGTDPHGVLDQARVLLLDHEIAHATIQVEPDDHAGCAELNW